MASVAHAVRFTDNINRLFSPALHVATPERLPLPEPELDSYENLTVQVEPRSRTFWCHMRPSERPSFTPGLLADLGEMQKSLKRLFVGTAQEDPPIRYFVVGSHTPGIFNLGGDLSLFGTLIRSGDRQGLSDYARSCIDVIHHNAVAYDLPIVTIAMVQGDALGGGFEAALSCDIIVAERSAKFGLPEILFNLFPGMGAYSFLSRRLGVVAAEKMIMSGRIFEAAELHRMGLVDVLADDGEALATVRSYIAHHARRHNAEQSLYRVRRRVSPIEYKELSDITDIWVEAALNLRESDLRKMERLTSAQNRRWPGQALAAAE